MNKQELVSEIRSAGGLTWKEAHSAVNTVFDVISRTVASDETVSVTGFGRFTPRKRSARTVRNPLTGGQVDVPERRVVSFKAGKSLRNVLNADSN